MPETVCFHMKSFAGLRLFLLLQIKGAFPDSFPDMTKKALTVFLDQMAGSDNM